MMKKLLLLIMMVVMLPVVFGDWQYQETVDDYYNTSWGESVGLGFNFVIDGNWLTPGSGCCGGGAIGNGYFNYTNSTLIAGSERIYWRIKDFKGEVNLTLPANCMNSPLQLRVKSSLVGANGQSEWYCWNGASWTSLRDTGVALDYNKVYEEGVYFDYFPPEAEASDFAAPFLTMAIVALLILGFAYSSQNFSRYATLILLLGAAAFGIWFLLGVIG